MRIVLQRVSDASVAVNGRGVAAISHGLLVLVGIAVGDTPEQARWLARKTVAMRIFNDENGVMNRSIADVGGNVLAVSQFTLYADARHGNRPGYSLAARPADAEPLYNLYADTVAELLGRPVQRGVFGADMKVSLTNDGPVTIILDAPLPRPVS